MPIWVDINGGETEVGSLEDGHLINIAKMIIKQSPDFTDTLFRNIGMIQKEVEKRGFSELAEKLLLIENDRDVIHYMITRNDPWFF